MEECWSTDGSVGDIFLTKKRVEESAGDTRDVVLEMIILSSVLTWWRRVLEIPVTLSISACWRTVLEISTPPSLPRRWSGEEGDSVGGPGTHVLEKSDGGVGSVGDGGVHEGRGAACVSNIRVRPGLQEQPQESLPQAVLLTV